MDYKIAYIDLPKSQSDLIEELASLSKDNIKVVNRGNQMTKASVTLTLKDLQLSTLFIKGVHVDKISNTPNKPINDERIIYVNKESDITERFKILYGVDKDTVVEEKPVIVSETPLIKEEKPNIATYPREEVKVKPVPLDTTFNKIEEDEPFIVPSNLSEAQILVIKQQETITRLKNERETIREGVLYFQQNIKSLEQSNSTLKLSLDEASSNLRQAELKLSNLELERDENLEEIRVSKQRIASLSTSYQEQEEKISNLNVKMYTYNSMESELSNLKAEMTQQLNHDAKLENQIVVKDEEITKLKYDLMEQRTQISALQDKLSSNRELIESHDKKNIDYMKELNTKDSKISDLERQVAKLNTQLENLKSQNESITKRLALKENELVKINEVRGTQQSTPTEIPSFREEELQREVNNLQLKVEELESDKKEYQSKPKIIEVATDEREEKEQRVELNLPNITFMVRGDAKALEDYYKFLIDNIENYTFLDLDTDSVLDAFIPFETVGNPNKWLIGKYLDLDKVSSKPKTPIRNSQIITSCLHGINNKTFSRANWKTLLESLPTNKNIVINLGVLNNSNVIDFINTVDCGKPYNILLGKDLLSARITKLALKNISAKTTLIGYKNVDYQGILQPNVTI